MIKKTLIILFLSFIFTQNTFGNEVGRIFLQCTGRLLCEEGVCADNIRLDMENFETRVDIILNSEKENTVEIDFFETPWIGRYNVKEIIDDHFLWGAQKIGFQGQINRRNGNLFFTIYDKDYDENMDIDLIYDGKCELYDQNERLF